MEKERKQRKVGKQWETKKKKRNKTTEYRKNKGCREKSTRATQRKEQHKLVSFLLLSVAVHGMQSY